MFCWSRSGFIVVFGSSHPALFCWADWTRGCRCLPEEKYDDLVSDQADVLLELFLTRLGEFLQRTLGEHDLTPIEKQDWIQSGLALSPLMATCTQYSLDFCLAWALIGEWTSRILFPVPKGPWPRHARSPRFVAWARAAFEQGALPSLLLLQGLVPIFTLPGDKMFQSTGISQGRQRPPIMHAYGGAKIGMAQALRSIASGVGAICCCYDGHEGQITNVGSVIGATVDIKVAPLPLDDRELDLLLSCSTKWDTT